MVMAEVFEKLRNLQEILTKKNKIEAEIIEAPQSLMMQSELLSRLKQDFIEKNTQYETIKTKINTLKIELHETENIREMAEKGMDDVSVQREYEILEKEISDAKKKENELRKELLKEEAILKQLDDEIRQDEDLIRQNQKDLNEKKNEIDKTLEEKKAELARLKKEEEQVSPGLNSETLFKFERIIKSKEGIGIVAVQDNVCKGCHMILPAQFVNEVREGRQLMYCPYCSRILYYVGDVGIDIFQEAFFDDADIGGLTDLIDGEKNK